MTLTMTLADIRQHAPCSAGWAKLLTGLGYADGRYDPDRRVSLGDVATTNDPQDALWCIRALDLTDVGECQAVVTNVVLPIVKRASEHTQDRRVHDCISSAERWGVGDDCADLTAAREEAWAAAWAAEAAAWAAEAAEAGAWAAEAAAWAAEAAEAGAWAAKAAAKGTAWAAAEAATSAAWAAWAAEAAWVAASAAQAAAQAAASAAEGEQQRADIIAAFPPVALTAA